MQLVLYEAVFVDMVNLISDKKWPKIIQASRLRKRATEYAHFVSSPHLSALPLGVVLTFLSTQVTDRLSTVALGVVGKMCSVM